jgi:antitoxin (DNA-binding transcriptional repressor) of toxin-antitoxin stability system
MTVVIQFVQQLFKYSMNAVTSREVIHNFSAVAARVAAGEELTVTRYGKPVLRLVQLPQTELSDSDRMALAQKALSFRMVTPYGTKFNRADAYED